MSRSDIHCNIEALYHPMPPTALTGMERGEYYILQLSSGKKYFDQPGHFLGKLIVTKSKVDKILNFPFS